MVGRTGQQWRRRSCQISAKEGVCPKHFFHGIWRSLEIVSNAMVTGAAGAASTTTTLCHQETACMWHGLEIWMLLLPPFTVWPARTLVGMEKLSRFLGKKTCKWGFCSETKLTYRSTHKKTQKDLYIILTTCIQRQIKPLRLVQAEDLWVMEVDKVVPADHLTCRLNILLL